MNSFRQTRRFCSGAALVLPREWKPRVTDMFNPKLTPVREQWIYNFETLAPVRVGLTQLHPRVFGIFPRLDMLHYNVEWQRLYKNVDYLKMPTPREFRTMNKRPWPRKGTGRARHASRRAPQFYGTGGWCKGPRGPTPLFFDLHFFSRLRGLMSCLTIKAAQNDLKIVDAIDKFPSDDPKFLEEMMDTRHWNVSALIVDKTDNFTDNLIAASDGVPHITLMKAEGLNCWSMLKHETLIMTYAALRHVEEKILYHWTRRDLENFAKPYQAEKVVPDYPNTNPWESP